MYLMNRDGFTLLAMGFTGKEALTWKMKYINAFNAMEQELRSQQQGLTEADFSSLSYEARAIIKMELQQKQQAKQIAELTTQQQEMFDYTDKVAAVAGETPAPDPSGIAEINAAFANVGNSVLYGKMTADEAAAEFRKQVTSILANNAQ